MNRPQRGFLHCHPGMEKTKEIDNNHVIVDREDWIKARLFPEMLEALKEVQRMIDDTPKPSERLEAILEAYPRLKAIDNILKELE